MISSMTGYGRAQRAVAGREIGVELRSVNHRYFEFSARLPRGYAFMEEKLKSLVNAKVARGKVDLSLTIVSVSEAEAVVTVNEPLAKSYLEAMRELGWHLGLEDDITLSSLARVHDLFTLRKADIDEDAMWAAVQSVAEEALAAFLKMRAAEGARLAEDIRARLLSIELNMDWVDERSPKVLEEYRARLTERLFEVLENRQMDEQRILTEAALFAEKTAVAEETVRLRSHIGQLREFLSAKTPVGRKLDFLVQEMNREANTIGSKGQDIEIARTVVELKSDIEKIREQIQNVE